MVYRARPSAECGDPGRADCRALHSLRDTPPLALDDGHPQYLSGVPYLGTIRGAARRSSFALLAETTGGARGICGAFLNNAGALGSRILRDWVANFSGDLGLGFCVVGAFSFGLGLRKTAWQVGVVSGIRVGYGWWSFVLGFCFVLRGFAWTGEGFWVICIYRVRRLLVPALGAPVTYFSYLAELLTSF